MLFFWIVTPCRLLVFTAVRTPDLILVKIKFLWCLIKHHVMKTYWRSGSIVSKFNFNPYGSAMGDETLVWINRYNHRIID
jgi:hypothetical protein